MKNKAFLLLGTAITISTFVAFSFRNAPNNFLQQLQEKFKQHQVKVAPEKLYLQFDRTQYKPGEDIWFQAYLRDANSLKASTQSSIIYVELWNPKGVLEKKLSLLAKDGLAHGDFALNEDAAGGIYKIKAYTNWQRNTNTIFEREISVEKTILPRLNRKLKFEREAFGVGDEVIARLDLQTLSNEALSNYEFDFVVQLEGKTILTKTATTNEKGRAYISFNLPNDLKTNDGLLNVIIPYQGQFESIARAIPIVLGEIDLQFFPEGGNQVSGIESEVAFKALNEFGKPADVAGVIEDEDGNIITAFESFHQGMGAFSFTAEKGESYFAKLNKPTGNQQRFELPTAQKRGFVLKVLKQEKDEIEVEVVSSEQQKSYLIAQARGKIYFQDSIQQNQTLRIPTKDFPIGTTQLTLFNEFGQPQCERLVFINPHRQLHIQMTTNKEKYLPREKVELNILVTDENQKPVQGDFSLAVVDEKLLSFADDKQGHLLSYMLLESDLKGEIVEPNFYFNKEEPKARKALDYLLMTQGWRRFDWEEVLEEEVLDYAYEMEKAEVEIVVKDLQNEPIKGATISVIGADETYQTNQYGIAKLDEVDLPMYVDISVPKRYKIGNLQRSINSYGKHFFLLRETEGYCYKETVARIASKDIQGQVTDDYSQPMIGANILLVDLKAGSQYGTVTNIDGFFVLENIPEGRYSLTTKFVGYNDQQINILEVRKTQTQQLAIVLSENVALEEVVVTGASGRLFKNRRKDRRVMAVEEQLLTAIPRTAEPPPPPPVIEAVPEEEIAEDEEIEFVDQIIEEETIVESTATENAMPPPPPPPPALEEEEIFRVVEEMPRFPGCEHLPSKAEKKECAEKQLLTYLYSQLRYPQAALEKKVEGICVVQFKIDKSGNVVAPRLVRSIGAGCGEAALEVVQNMQRDQIKWIAGKQRGKAQTVVYNMPIKFKLDQRFPYSELAAIPSAYYKAREFYTPKYTSTTPKERSDFRSTIYWQHHVQTDKNGKASVEFFTSDAITNFRATFEGFGTAGQIGRAEHLFYAQLPLSIATKIPATVLTGDLINLAVTMTNNSEQTLDGMLKSSFPKHFEALEQQDQRIQIPALSSKTIYLPCRVGQKIGKDAIRLRFESNYFSDEVQKTIETRSTGFKVAEVYGGNAMENQFIIDTEQAVEGTVKTSVKVYTNVLDEVLTGLERMLRQPNGCFEQTSSSNYPNILVLQYLEQTNKLLPELKAQSEEYLERGYKRLTSFECTTGGFEIFGRDPANVGLTAFGLMQFVDMAEVYPVEASLLDRTAKWLLQQRDGNGKWKIKGGLRESSASKVNGAYVTWAMCEVGKGNAIPKEIETAYEAAMSSNDDYQIALMANALVKIGDQRYEKLIDLLLKSQHPKGYWEGASSSMMRCGGRTFQVETTALATLALLRSKGVTAEVEKAMSFILESKSPYGFGSTQSTVLALKTILEYAQHNNIKEAGTVDLVINGKLIESISYDKEHKEKLAFSKLNRHFAKGKNEVVIRFKETQQALPIDLSLEYKSYVPQASATCPIQLSTQLLTDKSSVGENVRLTTVIENTSSKNQASPMALIAIPSGLALQTWQLKELLEQGKMDAYELFDGYLVLHYRDINGKEQKVINLDLKAEVAGTYQSPASYAYLYYNNEERTWSRAQDIVIE